MPAKAPPFGTIVHCELYSEDVDATKKFYTDVFGWRFNDIPGAGYALIQAPSRPHGGILARRKPAKPGGFLPPPTLNYILVESVDAASKKIVQAGGRILVPKYEVPGMGWFAVFEAPGGIIHNVVEAKPGAFAWWE